MSKTIEKQFQQWLTKVHGRKGLSRKEIEGRRMAFYSGAFTVMSTQSEIAKANNEVDAVAKMDVILQEITKQILKWSEKV